MTDDEVKNRILAYTLDKMLRVGYSKVTVDEIALDLGMSKKTIYRLFSSKEEMAQAAIQSQIARIEIQLEAIVSSDLPFAEKLAKVLFTMGSQVGKVTREAQVDMQRFAPGLWKKIEIYRRERIFSKIEKMILQARNENIMRSDVNERILVLMFMNSVQGIANPEVLSQNSFSLVEALRTIFRTLFEGSLTDEARRNFHVFDSTTSNL